MTPGDAYRLKAAEINAKANQEVQPVIQSELKKLALAYLRLADQADRNAETDVVYEPGLDRPGQQQQLQQQQQMQPKKPRPEQDGE